MRNFLRILLSFLVTFSSVPSYAGSPVIFKGNNAQMLPAGSLLTTSGQNIVRNGGVNYVKNQGAEGDGVGALPSGWITYHDAAATTPVDCTGGSPTATLVANATTPLRDLQDFSYVHTAANEQGDGISNAFTISGADTAKKLAISFDLDTTAANYTAGDLAVYVYDVTNATLITPSVTAVPKVKSTFTTTFDSTTSTSYRLCVHQAVITATAATSHFDNFQVGPGQIVQGAAVSDVQYYTPSTGNQGVGTITVGANGFGFTRIGSLMRIVGRITLGTVPASTQARIALPTGTTIGLTDGLEIFGEWNRNNAVNGGGKQGVVSATSGQGYLTFGINAIGVAVSPFTAGNSDVFWSSSDLISIDAIVPIAEWAGNGTVNLGNGTDPEYACSTTGTWDAAAAAGNTLYGPSGCPITGSLTSGRNKVVRFQYSYQESQVVQLQYRISGVWVPDSSAAATSVQTAATTYGAYFTGLASGTDATVAFSQYQIAGSSYNSCCTAATNWGTAGTGAPTAWRLVKSTIPQAVGFGLATATASGLVSNEQTATLTLDGTFTAGVVTFYRVGKIVTATITTATTYSSSANPTSTAAIGSAFRPTNNATSVVEMTGSGVFIEMSVTSTGTFFLASRTGATGTLTNQTSFGAGYSISYVVP